MARKLNLEEEQLFSDALRQAKLSSEDTVSDEFLRRVGEKRDTPLRLTAELAAWLAEDPTGPILS